MTLHIQPIAQSDALAMVKRQLDWMDKEIIDEQMAAVKKGYDYSILPPELRYSKEEAEELLDFLRNKNERLFVYTGLVYTYADSLEELDRQVEQVVSVAQGNSLGIVGLDYRQKHALNSMLPLGRNHVNVSRHLTTGQIAMQMPFASQELNQEGGGYYGQSKQSGNLVICNRKRLASPMGFVCGKPGSGKSFSVKREILNTVLAFPEDEVVIFDPAGEYSTLVGSCNGQNIRLAPDSDTSMNPFDLTDVEGKADAAQMAFKIDAFLALSSAMMAEGAEGLPEADKSIITRCVEAAYAQAGDRIPTLEDFYRVLVEQPEREARDIALRYERFVKGALSFFNRQSNVAFKNRVTNVDLHDLSSNMRVFGMLTALEAVRNRMYENFERGVTTWLYIDEVQSLFGHPAIIEYFSKFWAEGRKFNLICTGITQNSTYMLTHESARNMVHRRGAEPLRASRHHRVLLQVLGRGAQVQPHLHRNHAELDLHAHARVRPQHGPELGFLPAAQAVRARPQELGGPAHPLRHRGGLHRRFHQGRRGPARRGRRARADHGRLPEGRALRPVQHQARRDRRAQAQGRLRGEQAGELRVSGCGWRGGP